MADPKTYTEAEFNELSAERDRLQAKRDELLAEAKAAKARAKEFEGLDPAKARAAVKAAEDAEATAAAARGDFSAREKQLIDAHQKELAAKDAKLAKAMSAVHKRTAEAEIRRAIAKAEGDADLLLPHAMPFAKVRETEEDFEAYLEEKGQPLVADGSGTPLSFDTFVEQRLVPKFPGAFKGTGSTGGGATRSVASGAGVRKIPAGKPWTKADIDDIAAGKATADV